MAQKAVSVACRCKRPVCICARSLDIQASEKEVILPRRGRVAALWLALALAGAALPARAQDVPALPPGVSSDDLGPDLTHVAGICWAQVINPDAVSATPAYDDLRFNAGFEECAIVFANVQEIEMRKTEETYAEKVVELRGQRAEVDAYLKATGHTPY